MSATEKPVAGVDKTQKEQQESQDTHPLSSRWSLWSQIPVNPSGVALTGSASKRKQAVRPVLGPIYDIATVEDFWSVFHAVKTPSELGSTRLDVIFMRSQLNTSTPADDKEKEENDEKSAEQTDPTPNEASLSSHVRIYPGWEDVNNVDGGEFRFTIENDLANLQWETSVLSVLGGTFPLSDEICGVWLGMGRKSGSTISLWKRTPVEGVTPEDCDKRIAEEWLKLLHSLGGLPVKECTYTKHSDALKASKGSVWSDPEKTTWSLKKGEQIVKK